MTITRGIIIGEDVLPDTERVIRDPAAWWEHGDIGTRSRKGYRVARLVGHWTAGHARMGPTAGPKVVRAMKARKRDDGSPLDVGIHFVVSWDGLIWQCADLALAAVHVGHRPTILTSIGVECCWPGTAKQAARLGLEAPTVAGFGRGSKIACCQPSDELLGAWRWLADALSRAEHPLLSIPRVQGSASKPGVMEHRDVPGSTKVDAAGLLAAATGWP